MKSSQPTTEAGLLRGLRDDVYVVVGMVDPGTKRATFRFHINPMVNWIWIGVLLLISGATLSLWPEVRFRELSVWSYVRMSAGAATSLMLAMLFATSPARAIAPGSSSPGTSAETASAATLSPMSAASGPAAAGALAAGVAAGLWMGRRRARDR
jgi:hypothetical protein